MHARPAVKRSLEDPSFCSFFLPTLEYQLVAKILKHMFTSCLCDSALVRLRRLACEGLKCG